MSYQPRFTITLPLLARVEGIAALMPERFSWVGRACSICFRKSFVVRSLRASHRPAPRSLLGLQKHLLRTHFPPI